MRFLNNLQTKILIDYTLNLNIRNDIAKRVNSLLAIKKLLVPCWPLKNFNFPIGHWDEILFLIDHPSVKLGEQKSLLPPITIL
jgi:hypothetical protein